MRLHRYVAVALGAAAAMAIAAPLWAQDARPKDDGISAKAQELIAVLEADASTRDKARACQQLAAIGSEEAVPALAELLSDPKLNSYARDGLEAIAAPSAGDALLKAMERLRGVLQIGVINSIGVRRDPQAVDALTALARTGDTDTAIAALAALGRIATAKASVLLLQVLDTATPELRAVAASACLTCADRQLAEERGKGALRLYDAVRRAEVPKYLRLAGTYRAMVARQSGGTSLLTELLVSGDRDAVATALRAVRAMPGPKVSEALASELASASPELQVLLVQALAERKDERAQAAIEDIARTGEREARLAALKALGPVDVDALTFEPLFDGRTFDGWEGDTAKSFRIEDGAIVGGNLNTTTPRNEFLCTERTFANFVLRLECKVVNANGGVQFRSARVPESAEVSGYQADMDSSGRYWGCLYDEARRGMLAESDAATVERIVRKDDWNAYEIRCEGSHIQLFVNGVRTVDYTEADASIPQSGVIAVQVHAGPPSETWYRNMEIAELP